MLPAVVDVLVPALFVGVGLGVVVAAIVLLLVSAWDAEVEMSGFVGALDVLGVCTTGAIVWVGLERGTDEVVAEPPACMLKTRP